MEIYYVSLGEAINYCEKYLIKRRGMEGWIYLEGGWIMV